MCLPTSSLTRTTRFRGYHGLKALKKIEVRAYEDGVMAVFDEHSYLWVGIRGRGVRAKLYLHYFCKAYAPRLKAIVEAVKEAGPL
jgi:hypothetical protein